MWLFLQILFKGYPKFDNNYSWLVSGNGLNNYFNIIYFEAFYVVYYIFDFIMIL